MKITNTKQIKFAKSKEYQIVSYVGVVKKGDKRTDLDASALYSVKLENEYMFYGVLEPGFPEGQFNIINWMKELDGEFEIALYDRYKQELNYKGYKRYPVLIKDRVWYTLF